MRSLLEPFRFQTLSSLFWFAPCLSVRWVGCLVCLGFPPPLCAVFIWFLHSSFYISFWVGKLVLPINIISQFLKCWPLFFSVLLEFFMWPGHCKEHETIVELEVGTLLFAHQNETWEHPTPAETKMDWKIFRSCPFVLSFCLFSTITLAMFFLIVFSD